MVTNGVLGLPISGADAGTHYYILLEYYYVQSTILCTSILDLLPFTPYIKVCLDSISHIMFNI